MMLDLQNLVSDDQDLSQDVGAYLSTYSIDTGAAGVAALGSQTVPKDAGKADVEFFVQVTETFTTATTASLSVELVMADDAGLTSNLVSLQQAPGASVTVGIDSAVLKAGYQFRVGATLPPGLTKRYFGLRYNVLQATTTAGKVTAGIVDARQTNGYSV